MPLSSTTLFLLSAGLVFLLSWWLKQRKAAYGTPWRRLLLPAGLIVGGVAGASLPTVLASGDWTADTKTVTTALVLGYAMVETMRVVAMLPPASRDDVALPLCLSLAVLRLSCFHHGCCPGVETRYFWAVDFGDGVGRHPMQLYESGFHLAAAILVGWAATRGCGRGQLLRACLAGYCVFRFAAEWIRPEPQVCLGLTASQIVMAAFAMALAAHSVFDGGELAAGRGLGESHA